MPSKVILLLDDSGSMQITKDETIKAINTFIGEQKALSLEDPCTFSLIKFNHEISNIYSDTPMGNVEPITEDDYNPDGGTSLYDAIGSTIIASTNIDRLVLVILTDGYDTSSVYFTKSSIKRLIDTYSKPPYLWNILYLVSDPFLTGQGDELGIIDNGLNLTNMNVDFTDMTGLTRSLSSTISDFRRGTSNYVNINSSSKDV